MNSTFPWKNDLQLAHTRIQKEVLAKSWGTTRSRRKCATIRTWQSLIDILRPCALLDLRFLHHRVTWWRVCPSEDDASLVLFSVTSLLVVLHISSLNTLHRAQMSHVQTKKTCSMLPTTEAARCFSTKTPSTVMSKSSPVTIMTPGAICLIMDGFCKEGFFVPHFVDPLSAARKLLQFCPYIWATSTPKIGYWEKSSSSRFEPWCLANMWTWLRAISVGLRGGAAAETTSVPWKKPLQAALWQRRLAPPLWGRGSIPSNWADVCGFLKPPDSDRYWKVRMHGAFSIPRKSSRPASNRSKLPSWDMAPSGFRRLAQHSITSWRAWQTNSLQETSDDMSLWATKTRFTNHNCSSDSETRAREDLSGIESSPVPVLSSNVEEMIERWDPLCSDTLEWLQEFRENLVDDRVPEHRGSQPDETTIERGNPSESEIPEWLQEFRENLVDDEIPLQGGSHASSSHEASLEPTTKRREDLRKHSVYTHFTKDRNCEICKRTKITRAPCRRRNGEAVPRAAKFGDLITADHKV